MIIINEIRKNSLDTQAQIEDVMAEVTKLKEQVLVNQEKLDTAINKIDGVAAKQEVGKV